MDRHYSGTPARDAFAYCPLPSPEDTTRLLTLCPGQFTDAVCVTIAHETYKHDDSMAYECLSYAWGDADSQEDVHVRHRSSEDPAVLRCRPNLVTALKYLRHPKQPRVVWADAICINQDNVDERSRLVAHMGEIYKRATQIVVWLGEEDEGTATAFETIEKLSAGIKLHSDHRSCETIAETEAETVERHPSESGIEANDWMSLNRLMLRPWFKRLWVRQEVRLASKVVMKCGRLEIEWEKVEKVMIFLEQKVSRMYFKTPDIVRCRSLFPHDGSDSLMYALHRSTFCECTDPRDRVYANLSTSTAVKALGIVPDYTLSIAETFENLVIKYVQHFQNLELLRMCDLDSLPEGFKSFVPNFATPKSQSRLLSVYAHAGTRQSFTFLADGSAEVKGRRIDTIRTVSQAHKPLVEDSANGGNYLDIIKTYHQWEPEDLMTCSTYPTGGSLLDAFAMLLSNGLIVENYTSSHLQTGPESKASFLAAFASGSDSQQIFSPQHKSYLKELTSDRRPEIFFRTRQGYIGTSSSQVQNGDVVAVLLGASVPIVLRPSKDRQNTYKVVSPCYLQGVMFGEALLGPFPDGWRIFRDENREWGFKKHNNHDLTREDPRLWTMPDEWVMHCCSFDEEHGSCAESCHALRGDGLSDRWFFNLVTKEKRTNDPRLDLQGLEAGGVRLDRFILV